MITIAVKNCSRSLITLLMVLAVWMTGYEDAFGQGFGRNKPSYRSFDYKVFSTSNFDIYHYFEDDSIINELGVMSEKWFKRHYAVMRDSIETPNPVIIYENHPDFQQTMAISSFIGIGTGGVTESLKNRVIFPILETNAQTNHVLGHELVHAFQFNMLTRKDTLNRVSFANLPLWLVEGMAEYMSIGSVDPHTAMWMRDALIQDDFPTVDDLARYHDYFPYRWGHAFMAFVGRTWGDDVIPDLFMETAKWGYRRAIETTLDMSPSTFSEVWRNSYESHYRTFIPETIPEMTGEKILFEETAGRMNVSPSISPNGEYVAFFSEKDVFTLDLFIARSKDGKIVREITSSTRTRDIDGFNFLESMGTWSPDSRHFAYVGVKRGRNKLFIVDTERPRRSPKEIKIPGVPSFNNPSWSPDGSKIVMNGLAGGRNNIYIYDMESEEVEQVTNDRHSYIHVSWSGEGDKLLFSTDRRQPGDTNTDPNYKFNIGIVDLENGNEITVLPVFKGANNVNPVFSPDNESIFFLSDSDGFRNMYEYRLTDGKVYRMTEYPTGISGITWLAPAMSISREKGNIAYTYFFDNNYSIYSAHIDDFERKEVNPKNVDLLAATLPPFQRVATNIVDKKMTDYAKVEEIPEDSFEVKPFRPQFQLDYIGNTGGVGIAFDTYYGTGMSGGVNMYFSDIVGERSLFTVLAVEGEIYDFAGLASYINREGRIDWGATLSHIPYRSASMGFSQELLPVGDDEYIVVDNFRLFNIRTFEDQLSLFAQYPISVTRRIESSVSLARYYYRIDVFNHYYDQFGFQIGQSREQLDAPPGFTLFRTNAAYVGDNSYFGMASPMRGHRYRFHVDKYFGEVDMYQFIADYRRYHFFNPLNFSYRFYHSGRYGRDARNDIFYPLYLGFPGFLRGYTTNQFYELQSISDSQFSFNDMIGTRMLVANAELRLPFTGPEVLAVIESGFFFTELNLFFDAGVAWTSDISPTLDPDDMSRRFPFFSAGASMRVNMFGYLILEPYYALPIHRDGIMGGVFGLNFLPGW